MASSLLLRTALTQLEQALHRVIRWKLLSLRATLANPAALRVLATLGASNTSAVSPFTAVYVTSLAARVEWSEASSATDNGTTVFKPADRTTAQRGRWLITESTETSGYLRSVNFWDGETNKEQLQARIFAARPSVAIVWERSENDARSTIPGAIYDYNAEFTIWCIDENLRPRYEAIFGSDVASESGHPGVIAILGDVKKALADENKKIVDTNSDSGPLSLGGGVKVIAIGDEAMEDADLDGRVMIMSLKVTVHASVENGDDDSEHVAVTSVYVQPWLTNLHQQTEWDPANYIVSGYLFETQTGLTAAPLPGSARLSSGSISSTPIAHTFSEYTDTYCDLRSGGTITYTAASNNGSAPDTISGALRLGVVVTDSIGITAFEPIAAQSAAFGDPQRVIPEPDAE
jgi:hypothetical protein